MDVENRRMISTLRRCAQSLRHAPVLRSWTPLWSGLRRPYSRLLILLSGRHGFDVVVGGTRMRLHPEFATQSWETLEAESYRAFAGMLRQGDVVYDVGAHIGTYTLLALGKIGPAGRVVAYEPHDFTRRHLERHAEWSGDSRRILIRPLCCGAAAGSAAFYYVPGRAEGMNGLLPVDGFAAGVVDVTTIDREVTLLGLVPSVMKIDVEGSEWDVLKGAEETLRTHRPRISLSLHSAALQKVGATPAGVLAWLAAFGYNFRTVSEDHELHVIAEVPSAVLPS
jgi:FkbM family methyltransferase